MIVSTPSAHHPQAEVTLADPQTGVIGYRWLDVDGNPVDSGGSIAYATPTTPGEDGTYPDLTAEAIIAAIANPPVATVAPRRQSTRIILDRLTAAEAQALMESTQWQVRLLVAKATSTGSIHEDDADFPAARAALDALGIVATDRWDALFA